jgi:hypothetical protein
MKTIVRAEKEDPMRSDSELVCPFCHARHPFMGTAEQPFPFESYGDFNVYRCTCGAVGSPSGDVGEAGWPLDDVEDALCRAILESERGACHVDLNYITLTEPPMLMLWAKRWTAPSA